MKRIIVLLNNLIAAMLLALIQLYRWILSPFIGNQCRFQPTCSRYGQEAIRVHGPWKGAWLTLNRIRRCHPLNEGGDDPVPPKDG